MNSLNAKAWRVLLRAHIIMAVFLFIPAWTVHYWQAWLYLAVSLASTVTVMIYLMIYDQPLLERRLNAGPAAEQESSQRNIIRACVITFLIVLVVSGLEFRIQHGDPDMIGIAAGNALIVLCHTTIWRVYRENSFAAATVQVESSQDLVCSGPYSIIRHPMYLGAVLGLVGTPLALSSSWAAAPVAVLILLIVLRIRDEERVLTGQLQGYREYMNHVHYRLIPLVW